MSRIIHLNKLITLTAIATLTLSSVKQLSVNAQDVQNTPEAAKPQKICSSDPVENLLPSLQNRPTSPKFSYLAEQGFSRGEDDSWVCYVDDPNKEGRSYTLFKVKEDNGVLIGSSFLDNGNLIIGQDSRSLDFFMTLIQRHTDISQETQKSVRKYLEAFISLVKDGKITPSRRGFVFDDPNKALIMYHPLSTGGLKGTAITINIQLPKNLSSPTSQN